MYVCMCSLVELDEADFSGDIMCGFDLKAIHSIPAVGEVRSPLQLAERLQEDCFVNDNNERFILCVW